MPEIEIDLEMAPGDIDFELAEQLEKMKPFGEGNEEPVFLMKDMEISELKSVGNGSKHLKLSLHSRGGSPKVFEAIGFGLADSNSDLKSGSRIDIVFNLSIDEWNGNKKMQLRLIDLKKV